MVNRHITKVQEEDGKVFVYTRLEMTKEEYLEFRQKMISEAQAKEGQIRKMKDELVKIPSSADAPSDFSAFLHSFREALKILEDERKREALANQIKSDEETIGIFQESPK